MLARSHFGESRGWCDGAILWMRMTPVVFCPPRTEYRDRLRCIVSPRLAHGLVLLAPECWKKKCRQAIRFLNPHERHEEEVNAPPRYFWHRTDGDAYQETLYVDENSLESHLT